MVNSFTAGLIRERNYWSTTSVIPAEAGIQIEMEELDPDPGSESGMTFLLRENGKRKIEF